MFTNRTVQEIVKSIKFNTNNEFDDFLIHFDLPDDIGGVSIPKKETSLVKFLIKNKDSKGPDNANLNVEIIEYIIKKEKKNF